MIASPPAVGGLRAGVLTHELALTPVGNDPRDMGVQNGDRLWGAYSKDPGLYATVREGDELAPGWYRARVNLDCRSGDIDSPRIYVPDAQGHYSEARSVPLARDGIEYACEFYLDHPARQVRLDPSVYPCEFACNALRLTWLPDRPRGVAQALADVRVPGAHLLKRAWHVLRARAARGWNAFFALKAQAPWSSANRKKRVLGYIDKDGLGIEIGPSHDPIAPKAAGYKVHVIDHASRAELLGKYKDHPVPLDLIEEVDFIWRGESYAELTGKPKHYDWIIASHLIEHTPDLIAFLQSCDSVLKDDGLLCLVIPDKRYCFDRFRPITGLARIIDSHLAGNKIHSAGAAAEYCMNVAGKDHNLAWQAETAGDYVFLHTAQLAREMIVEVRDKGSYLDIHNWCFVPHSFRLLVNDLYALGYTQLREVHFHPTEGAEFYMTLGRHGKGPDKSRLEILRTIDAEMAAVVGK